MYTYRCLLEDQTFDLVAAIFEGHQEMLLQITLLIHLPPNHTNIDITNTAITLVLA